MKWIDIQESIDRSGIFELLLDVVKGELVSFDWEAQDNSKAKVLLFSDMTLNGRFFFKNAKLRPFSTNIFDTW